MGSVWERYILVFIRMYLGAFNLASGLNYFILFWPQPKVEDSSVGASYVQAAMNVNLFTLAKVLEATSGFLLVTNTAVPFALILLLPVTVTIFILNAFYSPLPHIEASGTRNMLFHAVLMVSYAGSYLPLLKLRAVPSPFWRRPSALKDFLK
jgi:hypothetical protein